MTNDSHPMYTDALKACDTQDQVYNTQVVDIVSMSHCLFFLVIKTKYVHQ